MPFLNQIVGLINQGLQANSLSDARFKSGDYNGIAINIIRDRPAGGGKQSLPCVYLNKGEVKYVGIDDIFPIIIYHKLLRNTSQAAIAKAQFGDGNRVVKATATMSMIVYADRTRIELSHDDLEAIITAGLVDDIPKASYPSSGFSTMLVTHLETNFNAAAVFAQEYQNVDFFLKPESILFQITYKIDSQYRKDCLAICGC